MVHAKARRSMQFSYSYSRESGGPACLLVGQKGGRQTAAGPIVAIGPVSAMSPITGRKQHSSGKPSTEIQTETHSKLPPPSPLTPSHRCHNIAAIS